MIIIIYVIISIAIIIILMLSIVDYYYGPSCERRVSLRRGALARRDARLAPGLPCPLRVSGSRAPLAGGPTVWQSPDPGSSRIRVWGDSSKAWDFMTSRTHRLTCSF